MFRKPKTIDDAGKADAADKANAPAKDEKAKKDGRTFTEKLWKEWVKPLGILLLVMWAARSTIADWNDVPSGSMEPTIRLGDRIVVNKLAYGLKMPFTGWHMATWGQPQRGEIIVFFGDVPDKDNPKVMKRTRLVKRVVAIEGDTVEVRGNRLLIGEHEHMVMIANPQRVRINPRTTLRNFARSTVPAGSVFVMGDNRDHSQDSRGHVGFVKREDISGHAFAIAFSLDYDSAFFSPRWERFFNALD